MEAHGEAVTDELVEDLSHRDLFVVVGREAVLLSNVLKNEVVAAGECETARHCRFTWVVVSRQWH